MKVVVISLLFLPHLFFDTQLVNLLDMFEPQQMHSVRFSKGSNTIIKIWCQQSKMKKKQDDKYCTKVLQNG